MMNRMLLKTLKLNLVIITLLAAETTAMATIHIIRVRDASTQFIPQYDGPIFVGDTMQWLPLDVPMMFHTITSTDIPENAAPFDSPFFAPADTFFQYVPTEIGIYNYVCLPHQAQGMIDAFTVEAALSTDWERENSEIRLFPNPVLDLIYIDDSSSIIEYRIYTIDGHLVASGKQSSNKIPVDELSRGLYVIELTGDRRRVQKFVKE
jgi:plastocyanin